MPEDIMAFFIKIILIFTASFSALGVPQNISSTKRPVVFNIKYSSYDLKFGKNLDRIFKQLKEKKIKSRTARNLYNSSLKTVAFANFRADAKKILDITKIKKSILRFHKYCTVPDPSKKSMHPISQRLSKRINNYCRYLFISLMLKSKNKNNISNETLNYFKYALPYYLKNKNIRLLSRYFRMIPSNSTLHRLISHYITDIYINHKI
ncbi:MAG: hypothetical protein OXB84_00700, partial [Halobacteriovoraceae bacterium]|nr:hypothetical protein [Halobacteriovoraceae bacterium]